MFKYYNGYFVYPWTTVRRKSIHRTVLHHNLGFTENGPIWRGKKILFHQDNALCHKLVIYSILQICHPAACRLEENAPSKPSQCYLIFSGSSTTTLKVLNARKEALSVTLSTNGLNIYFSKIPLQTFETSTNLCIYK